MIGKRFTTSIDKWFVIDNLTDKDYCLGNNKGTDNLVECLNNLHEENQHLRQALSDLGIDVELLCGEKDD